MTAEAALVPVVSRRVLAVAAVGAASAAGLLVADAPAVGAVAVAAVLSLGTWARRLPAVLPAVAVVLLYANVPVLVAGRLGLPPTIAALAVPGLLGLTAVLHVRRGGPWVVTPPTTAWMLLLLGATALAAVMSPLSGATVEALVEFTAEGLLLWFLFVQAVRDHDSLRVAVVALVATAATLALLSVFQASTASYDTEFLGFAQHDVEDPTTFVAEEARPARVGGPIGEKNRYGQVLLMVLPVALLGAIRPGRPARRLASGVGAGLCLVGVGLTASRGAAVAALLLATLVVMGELRGRVFAGVVAVLAAVVLVLPGYGARIAGTAVDLTSDDAVTQADGAVRGRLASNIGSLRVFLDHPVTGVGPGQYPEFHKRAVEDLGLRVVPRREPHNLYLGLAAETGLIGLLAFLAVVASTLVGAWNARRQIPPDSVTHLLLTGLALGVLAYLYAGLFLHLSFARYFWLLMGLTAAATVVARTAPLRDDGSP